MNDENLIDFNHMPESRKREIQRKGVETFKRNCKERKTFNELVNNLFEMKVVGKNRDKLIELGFKDDELTNKTLFITSLLMNSQKGNSKAIEKLADVLENNRKAELENEKLKAEIEKLKLERQKLEQEMGLDKGKADACEVIADALTKLVERGDGNGCATDKETTTGD